MCIRTSAIVGFEFLEQYGSWHLAIWDTNGRCLEVNAEGIAKKALELREHHREEEEELDEVSDIDMVIYDLQRILKY
tara:strand:- start:227 stop:457 length:231 start_codon:yes stop_codon:yes gene_type:complete